MIGKRFGDWVVIDRYIPRFVEPHDIEYYCRCNCGAKRWFTGEHVNSEVAPICEKCITCTDVPVAPDRIVLDPEPLHKDLPFVSQNRD